MNSLQAWRPLGERAGGWCLSILATLAVLVSLPAGCADNYETRKPERTEDLLKMQTALVAFHSQVMGDPEGRDLKSFAGGVGAAEKALGTLQEDSIRSLVTEREQVVGMLMNALVAYRHVLALATVRATGRSFRAVADATASGGHGPWRLEEGGALPDGVKAAVEQLGGGGTRTSTDRWTLELEGCLQEWVKRARGHVLDAENLVVQVKAKYRL